MRLGRLLGVLVPVLLVACSRHAPPPAADTAPYAAVARGRIDVEGGLLSLAAPREGTVQAIAVHEGDRVRRGQVLATLDPTATRLQLRGAEAALAQATARRALLDGRLDAARDRARRLKAAAAAGAGDGQSADAAAADVQALQGERAAADAALAMAAQTRDEAAYELSLRTLRAPLDAQVIRVSAQPGSTVSPAAAPLFSLLPSTPPIVRAEVNESYVDALTVGMAATVVSDGGGAERQWPAHVLRIGAVIGASTLQDDPGQRVEQRTVSCVLAFDRPPADVRIGQRVLVRFARAAGPAAPHPATGSAGR